MLRCFVPNMMGFDFLCRLHINNSPSVLTRYLPLRLLDIQCFLAFHIFAKDLFYKCGVKLSGKRIGPALETLPLQALGKVILLTYTASRTRLRPRHTRGGSPERRRRGRPVPPVSRPQSQKPGSGFCPAQYPRWGTVQTGPAQYPAPPDR